MSKNRAKQRENKRKRRYFSALAASGRQNGVQWIFSDEIGKFDECGRKDLTGYNAVKSMENENWILIYK